MSKKLPADFLERMENFLGEEEFKAYLDSFEKPKYSGLRINPLKISQSAFEKLETLPAYEEVPWCTLGYYYDEEQVRPTKDPYYSAGLYYIQEPSAMAPAAILEIEEGDKVLDLCAAPGGKSTMLGSRLNGTGLLVTNDISVSRTKALLKNIEMFGIKNSIITSEAPKKLAKFFPGFFDKILVDAPCSGEGMFRKDTAMVKSYAEKGVEFYAEIQREIMPEAVKMLKPGGHLLYSTCTFAPEENEATIQAVLDEFEDMEILSIDSPYFQKGRPDAINGDPALAKTARLWPQHLKGEGHYLALLHKKEEESDQVFSKRSKKNKSGNGLRDLSQSHKDIDSFKKFEKQVLTAPLKGSYEIVKEKLYLMPEGVPSLKGLRLVRQGWLLGELKKGRFEPHQAFAMALEPDQVHNVLSLDHEDPRVIKYLKGETIESEVSEGWTLVLVDQFPLGWGKTQRGKLKNKYNKGWRWL